MKAHLGFLEHLLDALGLIEVRRGEHLGREIEEVAAFGNDGLAAQHEVTLNFVRRAHGSASVGSEKRLAHGFKTSYTAKLYRILRRGHVGNEIHILNPSR